MQHGIAEHENHMQRLLYIIILDIQNFIPATRLLFKHRLSTNDWRLSLPVI